VTTTIAVAGKGGVGKTTIAGFLVRFLVEYGCDPILAVDADSNSNLNEVLNLPLSGTLGETREEMKKGKSQGMTKDLFIKKRVSECVMEGEGYDLIAMGRPEGAGCYCAANHLLTDCIDKLASNYKYLVVDNEAGMEHISRVITQQIDILLVISDASRRSLVTAQRVQNLAVEMKILSGKTKLIVSNLYGALTPDILTVIKKLDLDLIGCIPNDSLLAHYDLKGKATSSLPIDNQALKSAFSIFHKIMKF